MNALGINADLSLRMVEDRMSESRLQAIRSQGGKRDGKAREAASQFESYLLEHLLTIMQRTADAWKDKSSSSNEAYMSIANRALADAVARSGGIGITRMMEDAIASSEASSPTPPELGGRFYELGGAGRAEAAFFPVETGGKAFPIPAKGDGFVPLQRPGGPFPLRDGGAHPTVAGESPDPVPPAVPVAGPVTSSFGWRHDPFTGEKAFHAGVDVAVPVGTPVPAVADGEVEYAGAMGGYGNLVVVRHPGGQRSLYGHLDSLSVRAGDGVATGQLVGLSGNSGRSTGPHLHFETRLDGEPVDPRQACLTSRFQPVGR